MSKTTHSCPPLIIRRTMLAPIRPKPIMPSCISFSCFLSNPALRIAASTLRLRSDAVPLRAHIGRHAGLPGFQLRQRLLNSTLQCYQTALDIAQMDAKSAAVSFGQHLEVASRLRSFHHAERVLLSRHRQVRFVITRHLQEHAAIRTALISLPCRMQEARAESETGRDLLPVAHRFSDRLQLVFVGLVHLDVAEQAEVVARAKTVKVSLQVAGERFVAAS